MSVAPKMPATSPNLESRLAAILGPARIQSDPATLGGYAIDEILPSVIAKPASADEAAEIVRFAVAEKLAIIPVGSRSKLGIGMPPARYDIALDMTAINQIAHYDPGDLTLSVDTGLTLAKLNPVLAQHRQFLPFLLPFYSACTIGGAIASGLDSPLRQAYGTARDFLIGAEFIDGTGAQCKSGGRVVKNVTGYDLHKLLIGSFGTLAIITRLNFRTFPTPLVARGFVAEFPNAEGALALRRKIAESLLSPLTLDVLSPETAQIFATQTPSAPEPSMFSDGGAATAADATLPLPGDWFNPQAWQLCAAFAGSPEVLDRYAHDLNDLAQDLPSDIRPAATNFLDDTNRPAIWGRLREAVPLLLKSSPAATIFRLGALPEAHGALVDDLRRVADHSNLFHALVARASGVIYFALLPKSSGEETVAELSTACNSALMLCSQRSVTASILFCPTALKRNFNVFGSPRPDAPAMHRLKSAFDPHNIFAPGRMPL
jgi:glycolate oxidase FAD binding subunit